MVELDQEAKNILIQSVFIKSCLEKRLHIILSETNELVKQTMIDNFLIDL